jgi:TPR repeat protein/CHAT domain-containing protein
MSTLSVRETVADCVRLFNTDSRGIDEVIGHFVRQHDAGEVAAWERAARSGSADGQVLFSLWLASGEGRSPDEQASATWCRRAAEQGHPLAQYCLGQKCAVGAGVARNPAEAARWYQRSAEQGFARAEWNLGWMFEVGEGVAQDWPKAIRWYCQSAEKGFPRACHTLGALYLSGRGVPKNPVEARAWLQRGADLGHAEAQKLLAKMDAQGGGGAPAGPPGQPTVESCLQTFLDRNYVECVATALGLIQGGAEFIVYQLLLISLQRTRQGNLADQIGRVVLEATADRPWENLLLRVTLGHIDPTEALRQAADQERMCQLSFYAGARYVTLGQLGQAQDPLLMCAMGGVGVERAIALVELQGSGAGAGGGSAGVRVEPEEPGDVLQEIQSLDGQVRDLYQAGRRRDALPVAERLCQLVRGNLPEEHPSYTRGLTWLGMLRGAVGQYAEAAALFQEVVAVRRRHLDARDPGVLQALNNLASLYCTRGDHAAAEPLLREVCEAGRAILGENDQRYAAVIDNLGQVCAALGNYAEAEQLYRRAIDIRRNDPGAEDTFLAVSLNNLATVYWALGDYGEGTKLLQEVVAIRRAREDPTGLAVALDNLAGVYLDAGKQSEAEPLIREALALFRQHLGEGHTEYATALNNLATAYQQLEKWAEAEPLLRQAVAVQRGALGEQTDGYATALNNLANNLSRRGDYAAAEPLLRQSLACYRVGVGEGHPRYASCLRDLAVLLAATDRAEEALASLREVAARDDALIRQVFGIGSERQRTDFLRLVRDHTWLLLSLVLSRPGLPAADAFDLILRRKALLAEGLAAQRDGLVLGRRPDLALQVQRWRQLRARIARKTLDGPAGDGLEAHQRRLAEWVRERDRLEAELARQLPELDLEARLRTADRHAVARALPPGSVLVEFCRFPVCHFKADAARGERAWGAARYVAFVLPAGDAEGVQMIDLGEAGSIDQMIELFRAGVSELPEARNMVRRPVTASPLSPEQAGRQLRAAVFDPLLAALGGCRRLLLSPDGGLARLPFAVLPGADGGLLMDTYQISYVSCGRDVSRFGAASSSTPSPAVLVADPDFDLASGTAVEPATGSRGRVSRDLPRDRLHFGRLPGTRAEGEAIAGLLKVVPWQDTAAKEGRLKRDCRSPRILHLATHGFFLEDQQHDPNKEQHSLGLSGEGRLSGPLPENPLLRAGLALAGANTFLRGGTLPEEAEDGLLTAEDVSGLDLLATELVVLSACETGLGEVRTGEGVFGLQRAFTLAGARTLVMSLWSVPDEATRELMEDFYKRILAGEGRADALRNAQLALRKKYPDPYFWGAFICQGDPAPLRGQAIAATTHR